MLLRDLIGAVLRRIRLEQERTLRDVADAARVSVPYLSEVERGRKEPSSELLAAICTALHLDLTDLLDEVKFEITRIEVTSRTEVSGVRTAIGTTLYSSSAVQNSLADSFANLLRQVDLQREAERSLDDDPFQGTSLPTHRAHASTYPVPSSYSTSAGVVAA